MYRRSLRGKRCGPVCIGYGCRCRFRSITAPVVLDDEIDGRAGYTLIDCGITSTATKLAWEQLFDGAFEGKPLLRVICTHFHPDHFGLAHWLTAGGDRQRWTVPLWMTATEYAFGRYLSAGGGDNISGESAAQHFARNGLSDGGALQQVRERGSGYYPGMVPAVPRSFFRINEGDEIAIGPAHTSASIASSSDSAMHLSTRVCTAKKIRYCVARRYGLPRISPTSACSISSRMQTRYRSTCARWNRLAMLSAATLVLPSLAKPFIGLHHALRATSASRGTALRKCWRRAHARARSSCSAV